MCSDDIEFETRLEFDIIKEFIPLISKSCELKYNDLNNIDLSWSAEPEFCLDYGRYLLKGVRNLSFQLGITLLNKHIETTIKKIFQKYILEDSISSKKELNNIFKIKKLEEIFNKRVAFNSDDYQGDDDYIKARVNKFKNINELSKMRNYNELIEIRLISNAIKHESMVSKDLADFSDFWKDKEGTDFSQIEEIEEIYEHLLLASHSFIKDMLAYIKLSVYFAH